MKTSGVIMKLAAAGAIAMSVALATVPASAAFYQRQDAPRHEMGAGEHANRDRQDMWRRADFRGGRFHEHCMRGFHHEHRDEYRR